MVIFIYFKIYTTIMRKAIIKVKLNFLGKIGFKDLYDKFEKVELEEILKLDMHKGIKIFIANITLKEGLDLENLNFPKYFKLIEVIRKKGKTYTAIINILVPKIMLSIAKKFDLDLIFVKPTYFIGEDATYTCIGDNEDIQKFVKRLKYIGEVKSVSYSIADYKGYNIMSLLTDKQKSIFEYAKERGYYKYPRKIDGTSLAKELGLSKPTLIEHLRKIENKILSHIEV